jgi:heme/copper-type cytochrome/quinol oxidase subunit 1
MTGKLIDERIGKLAFWFLVPGFYLIFFPQHFLGLMGMPRRTQTYVEGIGLELWNMVSTIGTFIMLVGLLACCRASSSAFLRGRPPGTTPGTPARSSGPPPPRLRTTTSSASRW